MDKETLYTSKDLGNKLFLKQQLYILRMSKSASFYSHLDKFSTILMDLERVGVNLEEEEDHALYLICSLRPSYCHFRETMLLGN